MHEYTVSLLIWIVPIVVLTVFFIQLAGVSVFNAGHRAYFNYLGSDARASARLLDKYGAMLGIFIGVWHDLPLEAVTVWLFAAHYSRP